MLESATSVCRVWQKIWCKHSAIIMMIGIFIYLLLLGNGVQGCELIDNEDIEGQLKILNKPAIKTIKTEDGDIFDCVDIHKQLAFDHPLLKNHKLQMRPSTVGAINKVASEASNFSFSGIGLKGGGCPVGTVPIRRTSKEELLVAKCQFNSRHQSLANRQETFDNVTWNMLMMGVRGGQYYGSSAYLNIWPLELKPHTYTSVAAYVHNLPSNAIDAGWMVNPDLFKDSRSRLYASWTNVDNNQVKTGCFNMICPGFVQIDTTIPLGIAFDKMSSYDGQQYEIQVQIAKDQPETGSWWLYVQGVAVGYWPQELIPQLSQYATQVLWGGTNMAPNEGKLLPPMGSGYSPELKHGKACYVRTVLLRDSKQLFNDPPAGRFNIIQPLPHCYRIIDNGFGGDVWRRHIYLGGGECKISTTRSM